MYAVSMPLSMVFAQICVYSILYNIMILDIMVPVDVAKYIQFRLDPLEIIAKCLDIVSKSSI